MFMSRLRSMAMSSRARPDSWAKVSRSAMFPMGSKPESIARSPSG